MHPPLAGVLLWLVSAVAAAACSRPATSPPSPPPATWTPAPQGSALYPGQVIDLANWYLTLPTGEERNPDNVYQPQLNTFADPRFHLNDSRDGVVFTGNAGGVTTKGSTYPRSELREMNGSNKASWSNTTGVHTMRLRQSVTQLPAVKPHVVTAQIHDATDDVIEVRLEGQHLLVEYDNGADEITLDPAYVLGAAYDLEITASDGHIRVSYDGTQKADITISGSGWYNNLSRRTSRCGGTSAARACWVTKAPVGWGVGAADGQPR